MLSIYFYIGSNAFKHTWNGSVTVRLYIDKKDDKEIVVFEVSDTGENFKRFAKVVSII